MSLRPILIYDGLCALCNKSVKFVIRHEKKPDIIFVSMQSEAGIYLAHIFKISHDANSVVFLDAENNNQSYSVRSDVIIQVARYLRRPWTILSSVRFIPVFVRDSVYRFLARWRYRIWGKFLSCPLPEPKDRQRFVDSAEEIKRYLNRL